MKNTNKVRKMLILVAVILLIDQILKYAVMKYIDFNGGTKTIINNFFWITYVKNTGAAWGLFASNQMLLMAISLIVMIVFYVFFIRGKKIKAMDAYTYGILYGGILGNLIDRIFRGGVIDYLEFKIFGYYFPVFNFADMCIVITIILLILVNIIGDRLEKKNSI